MIETEAQALIVDAAKEGGGQALKLNNRFLVGVVDLLVKLPGHEPMWLEAKLHKFSKSTIERGYLIDDVGVTTKQKMYLRDWRYAGMLTGVASFVMESDGDVRSLRLALYSEEEMLKRHWSVSTKDHRLLGEKSERLINIREQLIQFARGE